MIQRCTKSCNIQSRNLKSFEDSNEISLKALEEEFQDSEFDSTLLYGTSVFS